MGGLGTLLCQSGVAKDGIIDCDACKVEVYVVFLLDELIGYVRNVVLSLGQLVHDQWLELAHAGIALPSKIHLSIFQAESSRKLLLLWFSINCSV